MQELFQAALSPANIVFTSLLVLVLFYWLTVMIGIFDLGSFDIDIDVDADIDTDIETDTDLAGQAGWFAGALHFFNFGRLPFMVVITFLVLSMWAFSILVNYYWGNGTFAFSAATFFPNLFVSLVLTKVITSPLVPIFEKLDGSVDPVDYIGKTCTLLLPASTTQMGQAEVLVDDSPLLINVKVDREYGNPILKGELALILEESADGNYYIIEKIN